MQYPLNKFNWLLTGILIVIMLTVISITSFLLYLTAFEEERERLTETVKSQALLMEAVAQFDVKYSHSDVSGGSEAATLSQIQKAHENYHGVGKSAEFTLAKLNKEYIHFLLRHRNYPLASASQPPKEIKIGSDFAEPMQLALSGNSGTIVARDYRGVMVLAAYEPVAILNYGVVAKIDINEIRRPFLLASLISFGIGGILSIFGIFGFYSVSHPLTERIRNSEKMLRNTFEQAAVGISHVALNGSWMMVNSRLCEIVGYSRKELLDLTFQDITHPDDLDLDLKYVELLLEGKQSTYSMEKRYIRKDGSIVWINLTVALVLDEFKKADYFISVIEDINDKKLAEFSLQESREQLELAKNRAEDANQAKSEFLSSMSHELRTPLNTILGYSELLDMKRTLDPVDSKSILEINKAGKHLLSLIDEILDLSKIESGNTVINYEDINVKTIIDESLLMFVEKIQENKIHIKPFNSSCHELVRADKIRLKQVLINLLSNAVKYNIVDGEVEISCHQNNTGILRISVKDTGIGIDSSQKENLFQPFHRLGKEAGSIEGSGIGLVIAKKLMKLMGGQIGYEENIEKGSIFWIELKLSKS